MRAGCATAMLSPQECDERVKAFTVNGVVCDGDIVEDASGRRCVPRATADAVAKLRAASLGTKFDPLAPSATADEGAGLKVIGALLVGGLVVYGLSRVLG